MAGKRTMPILDLPYLQNKFDKLAQQQMTAEQRHREHMELMDKWNEEIKQQKEASRHSRNRKLGGKTRMPKSTSVATGTPTNRFDDARVDRVEIAEIEEQKAKKKPRRGYVKTKGKSRKHGRREQGEAQKEHGGSVQQHAEHGGEGEGVAGAQAQDEDRDCLQQDEEGQVKTGDATR